MSEKRSENKLTILNSTAKLFDADRRTIGEYLKNIYSSRKLQVEAVIRKFRRTAFDGRNYNTQFYNLGAMKRFKSIVQRYVAQLICRKNNSWLN